MTTRDSIAHTTWICKYHVVWISKYRKKQLFGLIRTELAPVMKELARQKESEILQGALMPDHVHMLIAIPPKYAVSSVIGYIKGKSAIYIARNFRGKKETLLASLFGLVDILSRLLELMKIRYVTTLRIRRTKINVLINSACSICRG